MTPTLVIVAGPTATGKTDAAIALASLLPGVEIINADSRQVIRGIDAITAAPSAEQRAAVPHHLYGIREPGAPFSVADWLAQAAPLIDVVRARQGTPVVTGGTGLFIDSLLYGLDPLPPPDPQRRMARMAVAAQPDGLRELVKELQSRDPAGAAGLDLANPRRVIRALEILDDTGAPLADAWRRRGNRPTLPEGTIFAGLDTDKTAHAVWIQRRAQRLIESGDAVADVTRLLAAGVAAEVITGCGIGCREAIALAAGEISPATAATGIADRTRRYAKAQRTYLRRDDHVRWVDAALPAEAVARQILG